jgi:hypothetical protein
MRKMHFPPKLRAPKRHKIAARLRDQEHCAERWPAGGAKRLTWLHSSGKSKKLPHGSPQDKAFAGIDAKST